MKAQRFSFAFLCCLLGCGSDPETSEPVSPSGMTDNTNSNSNNNSNSSNSNSNSNSNQNSNSNSNSNSNENSNSNSNGNSSGRWPIERVSVGSGNREGDDDTTSMTLSGTGRYAVFVSEATNFSTVPNLGRGVFRRDRDMDVTVKVDLNGSGASMGSVGDPDISDDGRYILFGARRDSFDNDLRSDDSLFLHDVQNGTTAIVALTNDDERVNGDVSEGVLSGDANVVVFNASGLNLAAAGVYARNLTTGVTRLVSSTEVSSFTGNSGQPQVDDDGSRIVFRSNATNVGLNSNGSVDQIYFAVGTTNPVNVSVNGDGDPANANAFRPAISSDGRWVAFFSTATNLLPGATDSVVRLYLRDTQLNTTVLASVDRDGNPMSATGDRAPGVSSNGRFVAFSSVDGDDSPQADAFVFDRDSGTSTRVSLRFDRTSPTIGSLATTLAGDASSVGFRTSSLGMVEDQVEQHNEGYAVTFPVPE